MKTGDLALGAAVGVALAFASVSACSGSTGVPAAPSALESLTYDGGPGSTLDAKAPVTRFESLAGHVESAQSDAGVAGAFVVGEVGGFEASGGAATVAVDSRIEDGERTIDGGAFAFANVPAGPVGLRVFDPGYFESRTVVAPAPTDASLATTRIRLVPLDLADAGLARADGGAVLRPIATGLTASSLSRAVAIAYVVPAEPIAFAVRVAAGSPDDPLSADVILVQASTGWAAALAPPTAAVPGGPYPDGIYSRIVSVPSAVGAYTYTLVVASTKGVTSLPVSTVVTVTATGMPPLEAGVQ